MPFTRPITAVIRQRYSCRNYLKPPSRPANCLPCSRSCRTCPPARLAYWNASSWRLLRVKTSAPCTA